MTILSLFFSAGIAVAIVASRQALAGDPLPGDACDWKKGEVATKSVKGTTSNGMEVQLDMWCRDPIGDDVQGEWKVRTCSYPAGSDKKKNPENFWEWDHKKGFSVNGKAVYLLCIQHGVPEVTERDKPKIGGDCVEVEDGDRQYVKQIPKALSGKPEVTVGVYFMCQKDKAGVYKWRPTKCCELETYGDNCKEGTDDANLQFKTNSYRVVIDCNFNKTSVNVKSMTEIGGRKTSGGGGSDTKTWERDGNGALTKYPK